MLSSGSLVAVLVAGACAYTIYQCVLSPLAAFPGPLAAKLAKSWRSYSHYRGNFHRDLVDLHERYGPVVRIGPNELSVGDPEAFRKIYSISNAFPKGPSYSVLRGTRPFDLANERDEKVHGAQRRLVARPYSMESMKHLEPQISLLLESLLRQLDNFAESSQAIDLGYWVQLFAFDVVGAVSFGKSFDFVSSGSDNDIFIRLERTLQSIGWVIHSEWFFWLHQKVIMPYFGNWLAMNDRNGFFHNFAKEQVEIRKVEGGERDIAGQLFQVQASKSELTDTMVSLMMTTNVFAGSDTTSTTMRGIFLSLMRNPRVLAKLQAELQQYRASDKPSAVFSSEEAESCQYLQAVIYEGMRVFPVVSLVLDRDTPPEGMTICGRFVPGGTVVGSSPWVIHRMREVWGDDAEEFRPERWLDKDNVGELRRFFFGFGGGTRTCIGRNISWLEIEKLVATLVTRYDFKFSDDANIHEQSGALVFLKGMRVQLTRRDVS
ncbi:cytochrome P450 family protein [Xylariaceae sp. AK1471]|nr:cytochrome P450 family protein [Xylariaceae sp. AK1471]